MVKIIFLSLILAISGCASGVKKIQTYSKTYDQPKLHNADCFIENQVLSEANVLLLEETHTTYKVRAGDGKVLGLPINQCILSQIPLESSFFEDEPNQRWVKCKLGPMTLVTDALIYQNDEKHFYRLKRKDGQVWMLPREHCSIFHFPERFPTNQ